MALEVRFVSDMGRPGTCGNTVCHHDEFDHVPDGPCRKCHQFLRVNSPSGEPIPPCERYEPQRYFDDPED